MRVTTVDAPTLAGSRSRAREVVAQLPADLTGVEVVLNCRGLMAAAASFADEIVTQILVDRHAESLRVVDVSDDEFVAYLQARAADHGVLGRLHLPD